MRAVGPPRHRGAPVSRRRRRGEARSPPEGVAEVVRHRRPHPAREEAQELKLLDGGSAAASRRRGFAVLITSISISISDDGGDGDDDDDDAAPT
ncbi:unnamed protein product [Merluccius merluccius]